MPGTRLGMIVGQIRRAATWLAGRAPSLGADPARPTVRGHSAGAHLASLLAATTPNDPGPPQTPIAGLLLSGKFDLADIPGSFLKDGTRMTKAEAASTPRSARAHPGPRRIIALGADETPPFHDQTGRLHRQFRSMGIAPDVLPCRGETT